MPAMVLESEGGLIAAQPSSPETEKCSISYALPHLFHEAEHEVEVVNGGQAEVGQLSADVEVAKIGPGDALAGGAAAMRIDGPLIGFKLGRFDVQAELILPASPRLRGEQEATPPSYSGGGDAVKGVDASGHAL